MLGRPWRLADYLVTFACLGWLVPLGFAVLMLWRYGYFYGSETLTAIPIVMIALTFIVNGLPRSKKKRPTITYILIGWTALAIILGVYWLIIWMNRF